MIVILVIGVAVAGGGVAVWNMNGATEVAKANRPPKGKPTKAKKASGTTPAAAVTKHVSRLDAATKQEPAELARPATEPKTGNGASNPPTKPNSETAEPPRVASAKPTPATEPVVPDLTLQAQTDSLASSMPASKMPASKKPAAQMPATASSTPVASSNPSPSESLADPPAFKLEDEYVAKLIALNDERKLLGKKEYPVIRKMFADRFEKLHGDKIRQGAGEDADAFMQWLADHPEVREEWFIAIDPAADQIPKASAIFNELRKKFPEKIVPYYNLAIAISVVWDAEKRAVYDYGHHANRCKAMMPAELLDAAANFDYLVAAEPVMEGRIQYVPWEFLLYVVNHRTPKQERVWALQNYGPQRSMFGKCYSTVPYDHEMLNSKSETAKLNGKPYTLPNLLTFGGVCAMQADYSARVGKSIGVASEYVSGEAAGGELHAWVMWVELKQATPTGLSFSLESHGRYRGDKYYVGHLTDPQNGKKLTDRDLELRLQTVGLNTVAKRHTDLVMQSYDAICEQGKLDTTKKLNLLHQIIQYNPGSEDAWLAVARLARESNGEKQYNKQFQSVLNQLFITFATIPDFTWRVFGDLAAYYPEGKPRAAMYEKLIAMYEVADRPDLACEARLAWAEMIAPQDRQLDAVQGLAATVLKFPHEGRYVPKLLDKLEQLCDGVKGADQHVVQFYVTVLPKVPQTRGSSPSPFAMRMFERAATVFTRYNQPQLAMAAQAELEKIKSGKGIPAKN